MGLDRVHRNHQIPCDLEVGAALHDLGEHLPLPGTEGLLQSRPRALWTTTEGSSQGGIEIQASFENRAQRLEA